MSNPLPVVVALLATLAAPPALAAEPGPPADVTQAEADEPSPDRLSAAASAGLGAAAGNAVSQVAILAIALPVLFGVDLGLSDDMLSVLIGAGMGIGVPLTAALGGFLGALPFTSVGGAIGVGAIAGGVQLLLVPSLVGGLAGLFIGLIAGLFVSAATGGDTEDTLSKSVPGGALAGLAVGSIAASSLTAAIAAAIFAEAPSE